METITTAPLKNVTLFAEVLQRVIDSPNPLPKMATFHGFSGYGKTIAATYAANKTKALYIEMGDSWSKHGFCDALLSELGTPAKGTLDKKVSKIIESLIFTGRPLIIDEFDIAVKKGFLDLVREIHDKSYTPMILIGEELLPQKLEQNERFHNRILDFVPAQPADKEDVAHLARLYCPGIVIETDLLERMHRICQGRPRRIVVNLNRIREFADLSGLSTVDLGQFGEDRLATGLSPARRAA